MKVPSAFSIGRASRANEQKKSNLVPGPGTHTVNTQLQAKKTPSWGFGRQNKYMHREKDTPGPGSYDVVTRLKANKFTMRKRDKQTGQPVYENPGPEKYSQKNVFKFKTNPQFSFGTKADNDKMFQPETKTPGVGKYNVGGRIEGKGKAIGKEKRKKIGEGHNDHPGPAQFNTSRPISAGPMYRFSRKNYTATDTSEKDTPGPGKYNIKSQFDDHWKAKTVGQRTIDPMQRDSALKNNIPGPGAYDPQNRSKKTGPSYKIGTGQREVADKRAKIGPGHYECQEAHRPRSASYKIGLETRRPLYQVKNTPGPGNYLNTDFINDGCQIGIHGKKEGLKIKTDDYPGPGEYMVQHHYVNKHDHQALIGTSLRQTITNHKPLQHLYPGPGHYNYSASGTKGPKTVFGRGTRDSSSRQDHPGPGSYNIPNTIGECNKYSMDPENLRSLRFGRTPEQQV